MTAPQGIVFLLDVDNTLLDNDQIIADLRLHLERDFGAANAGRYWTIFEKLRSELGYADYLGALQRYRSDAEFDRSDDLRLLQMSTFLLTIRSLSVSIRAPSTSSGAWASTGARRSFQTATSFFNPARSSARVTGIAFPAGCSSISTRSRCSSRCSSNTPRGTT